MYNSLKKNTAFKWVAGLVVLSLNATALLGGNVATMEKTEVGVYWTPNTNASSFQLTVVGPKGFRVDKTCDTSNISITEFGADGLYKFELTANEVLKRTKRMGDDRNSVELTIGNSKDVARDSGYFRVSDGHPVFQEEKE